MKTLFETTCIILLLVSMCYGSENYDQRTATNRFFYSVKDLSLIRDQTALKEFGESPVYVLWGRGDVSIFTWGKEAWATFYNRKRNAQKNKYGTFIRQNGLDKWVSFDEVDCIRNECEVKLKDATVFPLLRPTQFNPEYGGMRITAFSFESLERALKEYDFSQEERDSSHPRSNAFSESGPSVHPGWPQDVPGTSNASPVIADLDGDGTGDLITASETTGNQSVFAWREDGTLLEGWPVDTGYLVRHVSAGDIDGDGMIEIVASCEDTKMYVWRYDGTLADGWPVDTTGGFSAPPALGDLEGDGGLEIVIHNLDGLVYAWHHDGTAVSGWPINMAHYWSDSTPGLVDIDGDGDLEVFVVGGYYDVYAWHHDGTPVAGWPVETEEQCENGLAIGDIDGNGKYEIVATEWVGFNPYPYAESRVHAWASDGAELLHWPVTIPDHIQTCPSLGDVDDDGDLEIFQSSRDDKLLYAWHHDGSPLEGWPVQVDAQQFINSPSIGDIDGDGIVEVLTGCGWYSSRVGKVYAFHPDGSLVDGWPFSTVGTIYGTISVGDIDVDGQSEIAVGTSLEPRIYLWDIDGAFESSQIEWATFAHDFRRTSVYGNSIYENSSPITLTMTPPADTNVAPGEIFGPIEHAVTNTSDTTYAFLARRYVIAPSGSTKYWPVVAGGVPAETTIYRTSFLPIPTWAPVGTYTYGVELGDPEAGIIDSDSFEFTVEPVVKPDMSSSQKRSPQMKNLLKIPNAEIEEAEGWQVITLPLKESK